MIDGQRAMTLKAQAAIIPPTTNITLKRKVGYGGEDEEVFQAKGQAVRLNETDSSAMEE